MKITKLGCLLAISGFLFQVPLSYAKPILQDYEVSAKHFTDTQLNLSDEQRKKIDAIRKEGYNNSKQLSLQFQENHNRLNKLVAEDQLDKKQLNIVVEREKDLVGKEIKKSALQRHAIHLVLNKKQGRDYQRFFEQRENTLRDLNQKNKISFD